MQNTRYIISVSVKVNAKQALRLQIYKKNQHSMTYIFRVWIKSVNLAPK